MDPVRPTLPSRNEAIVASTPRQRLALAAILLLACLLRAGWVGLATLDPFDGVYFDMAWYQVTALQLAAGKGLSNVDGTPTAQWPPLYPALLSVVYRLTDGSFLAGKLFNSLLGALTTWFVYGIGLRLVGRRAGLLAALFYATSADAIFFSNYVMSEVAFGTVFSGAVWLFTVLNQREPPARGLAWFGLGLALGLASLTRGIAIAWVGIPLLIWLASTRSWRPALPRTALALLGIACVIAPWTARNQLRMGYPVLIATSVGMVLANAHSPWETGGPSLKTLVYRKNFRKQFAHLPQPQREVAVMRAFTRVSLEYMLTHPRHELRVLPNRVVQLFKHGHIGLEIGRPKLENGELKPVFGPGGQRLLAGYADLHFFALLALGLLGLPRLWRSPDRTAWLVPLSLAYFCFWHLLIFPAHPRYHFPMLPFLALSAASLWSAPARPAPAREAA